MPRLREKRPQLPHLPGTDIAIEVAAPFQVAHEIPVLTFSTRGVGGPESETALIAREEVEGEELPRPGASCFGALAADALQIQYVLVSINRDSSSGPSGPSSSSEDEDSSGRISAGAVASPGAVPYSGDAGYEYDG
ncbi:hypothetical protein PG984_010820 [Apiospora sp. TS-2023a]